MNFAQWMRQVNLAVIGTAGVSVHDLADQPFRDWYEDEVTPEEAADMALEDEGWSE